MKRNLLKYTMVFLMLGAGALVYMYAQKGYLFRKPETKIETKIPEEEQTEDIGTLTGDDPWKEMDKLVGAYYNKQGVSYKGSVKLIDDNGNKEKVVEEQKFEYSTIGQNMYYRLGNMEFVSKSDLVLIADHTNKIISVSRVMQTENKPKKLFDISEFKKLMEDTKAEAKVTQLGNQKILTIENITDPQIQGYRIYYDPETYHINKMLIGMLRLSPLADDDNAIDEIPADNTEQKTEKEESADTDEQGIETYTYYMEITYDEMKSLGITEKTFNPENKFISKSGDKIELAAVYSKYQLISNGTEENKTETNSEEQE